MVLAALDVLRPVAHVLVGVKYKIGRAGHVVLALSLAHVVVGAVVLVRVVADVAVLLRARHLVGWMERDRVVSESPSGKPPINLRSLVVYAPRGP